MYETEMCQHRTRDICLQARSIFFESLERGAGATSFKNFDEQKEKRKKENSELLKSGGGGTPL